MHVFLGISGGIAMLAILVAVVRPRIITSIGTSLLDKLEAAGVKLRDPLQRYKSEVQTASGELHDTLQGIDLYAGNAEAARSKVMECETEEKILDQRIKLRLQNGDQAGAQEAANKMAEVRAAKTAAMDKQTKALAERDRALIAYKRNMRLISNARQKARDMGAEIRELAAEARAADLTRRLGDKFDIGSELADAEHDVKQQIDANRGKAQVRDSLNEDIYRDERENQQILSGDGADILAKYQQDMKKQMDGIK